jgi:IS30 family transposase
MPGTALLLDERVTIEVGIVGDRTAGSIADELDRAVSTVRREIRRNRGRVSKPTRTWPVMSRNGSRCWTHR